MKFLVLTCALLVLSCAAVHGESGFAASLKGIKNKLNQLIPDNINLFGKVIKPSDFMKAIPKNVRKSMEAVTKHVSDKLKTSAERIHSNSSWFSRPAPPERMVICFGLVPKLKKFVAEKKIKPLTKAIRAMVSKTYHSLNNRSGALIDKHGLKLDEEKARIVLKHAVSSVGIAKSIMSNALGKLGTSMVQKLGTFNHSLTPKQSTTLACGFSAWLGRRYRHLQQLIDGVLRQHHVILSRPEIEETVGSVLRKLPTGAEAKHHIVDSFIRELRTIRSLSSERATWMESALRNRLAAFAASSRRQVQQLLFKHHVSASPAQVGLLLGHLRAHLPSALERVQRFFRDESRKVMAQIRAHDKSAMIAASSMEAYIREMVLMVNAMVERLAHRNISAAFTRHNVTADANALLEVVHEALLERAGVVLMTPRELRMKVRLGLPYVTAITFAEQFKRELRREVARVAEVLASEVQVVSMDDSTAVHFRIVAPGFDPVRAQRQLERAIAGRRFTIEIEGHRVYAIPPPHLRPPPHRLPWSVMIGGAAAVAVILLALAVSAVIVAVRRRRRMALESEDSGVDDGVSGGGGGGISKIPYSKVEEVYA